MKVLSIITLSFFIAVGAFGQHISSKTGGMATLDLIIKNSPKQTLVVYYYDEEGASKVLDSLKLGQSGSVDTIHYDIPLSRTEMQLNLFCKKKGLGAILPVIQPGDHLQITSELGKPEVTKNLIFAGSARTREFFEYLKHGNDLSILYWAQHDKYLNSKIDNKPDSTYQKNSMDSLNQVRINYDRQKAFDTESPAIFCSVLSGINVYKYHYTAEEYDQFRQKFSYDPYTLRQIDHYQKAQEFNNNYQINKSPYSTPQIETSLANFTLPALEGKPAALSQFKGKYVLVDFWASWCAPCRMQTPYLKEAIQRFGKKNFMILSVSIDEDHTAWKKAIAQDSTQTFTHLIDDKGWKGVTVLQYGIKGIPCNFLLDPTGKIIDKDLYGKDMIVKLNDVLKSL